MSHLGHIANSVGSSGTAERSRDASHDTTSRPSENPDARLLSRTRRATLLNRVVEAEILPRLARARADGADSAVGDAAVNAQLRYAQTGTTTTVGYAQHGNVQSGNVQSDNAHLGNAHLGNAQRGDLSQHDGTEAGRATTEHDAQELVRLLTGPDDRSAGMFIERLEQRGATAASLYLGIITGAARRLGELWEEDRCDFTQVTISLGRLQQIVRALSPSFQTASVSPSAHADSVLLLPAPGEQHTLGLVILSEFFRREGWQIAGGPLSTGYDAAGLVRSTWIDVVGFSIGSAKHLDNLAACISMVRRASRNRYIGVMVGGPLFFNRPDLITQVGADTTAVDAPGAVRQARGLLAMQAAAD